MFHFIQNLHQDVVQTCCIQKFQIRKESFKNNIKCTSLPYVLHIILVSIFFLIFFLQQPLSTYLRWSSHFQTKASSTTIQLSPQYCKFCWIKVINSPQAEPKSNLKPFLTLLIPPPVTISTTKYIWPLLSGKCPRPGR